MASSSKKIRGITIEMSADATEVINEIHNVDKAAKNTQTQLRDVEKLLKFDPGNTELLAQKQRLLADAAEEAQKKEKLLYQAMEDLDGQLADGQISQQRYNEEHDALQRELIETDRKLDGYQSSLKEISDTTKDAEKQIEKLGDTAVTVADKLETVFSGVEKVGNGLTIGLTAPIVALSTAGVKTYLDLDDAASRLARQTGAATEETEKYRDILEEIYNSGYGESYEDIADSMATVRQNLGEMDDLDLRILTEDALTLRDTFEYDVTESTRAAKAMMDNFGISAKDAFNYIVTGSQNGLNYSGELLDSISEYSVQFAKVGLDADDMFNIFAEGYETGAWNIDKVGDAIKEFSNLVLGGSESTINALKNMGLNVGQVQADVAAGGEKARDAFFEVVTAIAETEDPFRQATEGTAIFGTMWEDLGPEVVTQLANISDGTYDAEGAMDALNDSMSDAQEAEQNMREAQSALSDIGESLVEIGLPALESLSGILSDASDWFASLDENGQNAIITIAGIATVTGPVVKTIGNLGGSILTLKGKIDSMKTSAGNASQAVGNINTSATNAAGSSGGISKLGSTLGTIFSGVGIVAAGIGLISGLVSWINDLNDAATNANFSHFSEQWDTINTGLSNARSNLEDYNDLVFESNGRMSEIETELSEVQSNIMTICNTASQERRDLTQEEIDKLEELLGLQKTLTEEELGNLQRVVTVSASTALLELQSLGNEGMTTFVNTMKGNYATIMDSYQQVAEYAEEWYADQAAQIYARHEVIGDLNSDAHKAELTEARNQANAMKQTAQEQVSGILETYTGFLEDKYNIDSLVHQETETYGKSIAGLFDQLQSDIQWAMEQGAEGTQKRTDAMNYVLDKFATEFSATYQDLTYNLDEETVKAVDTWMYLAYSTEQWGGQTSEEAQQMVDGIILAMDKLPDETKESFKNVFEGANQIIDQWAPEFTENITSSLTDWTSRVKKDLGINSPSRVMKQLFGYVMQGAQIGFEDGADQLLTDATNFANDFTDAMTPQTPSWDNSLAMQRMQAVAGQGGTAVTNRQNQFSISVHIDRFENRTDQDINTLAQKIMNQSEIIYKRRAAAYGAKY